MSEEETEETLADPAQRLIKQVVVSDIEKANKLYHLQDTANRGSSNGRAKLTEEDVRKIRLRRKNGE